MRGDELTALPALPPSVAEWEDLLVRVEIMPRALRNALDGVPEAPAATELLRELVAREAAAAAWLEAVAGLPRPDGAGRRVGEERSDGRWLSDRFASLRARNFAMVQRRGVEVWGWEGEVEGGGRATVYQLFSLLVRRDAEALAALRRVARAGGAPC